MPDMGALRIIVDRAATRPSGKYEHKLGGYPTTISAGNRPMCGSCGAPLLLLLQLDCSDPLLESYRFATRFVYIYDCEGCQTTWDPMFYKIELDRILILHQNKTEGWELKRRIVPEFPIHLEPLTKEQAKEARSHYQRDSGFGKCHLMGVTPVWIQGSGRPECIECGKKMKSIIQLDSDMSGEANDPLLMFGDCGCFYVHRCEPCDIFAVHQQCY
jgi:hypothetical protein